MSYELESVFGDLLHAEIDESQNLLGHRWLERGTFATLIGSSGIGKSVAAMQIAIQAAAGLPVFGIKPVRPLRVLVVQAEDSRNDRIDQVQCAPILVPAELHQEMDERLYIYTTTDERGADLFNLLENAFTDSDTGESIIDFFVFNPAFAFFDEDASVEDSSDVGFFLRSELLPFLQRMNAAGLVVHHTSKLTHRDTSNWSTQTYMYSGHGSAEWTNAPRGVITIDGTFSPTVFEFRIAKRGSKSGWELNGNEYLRYFSHSPKGQPMYWVPSTEEEIAEAQQPTGLKDRDVMDLFSESKPELSKTEIHFTLKQNGFKFTVEEIDKVLGRLISKDKIRLVEEKYVLAKTVKQAEREEQKAEQKAQKERQKEAEMAVTLEKVFNEIKKAGKISVTQLFLKFGGRKEILLQRLETLVNLDRITFKNGAKNSKMYYVKA